MFNPGSGGLKVEAGSSLQNDRIFPAPGGNGGAPAGEEDVLAVFLPLFGAGGVIPGDGPVVEHLRLFKEALGAGEVQYWRRAGGAGWTGYRVGPRGEVARGAAGSGVHGVILEKLAARAGIRPERGGILVIGGRHENGNKGVIMAGGLPGDLHFPGELGRVVLEGAAARAENAALRMKLERASNELEALGQISNVMSLTADFTTILGQCIEQMKNVIGADSGGVLLFDPAGNRLVLQRPAFGSGRESFSGYTLEVVDRERPGMGAAVRVFITGQPYISNSPSQDPVSNRELVEKYGVHCSLTVPLTVGKRRLGVLHLVNTKKGSFNGEDARMALILASKLAVVIDNARLFANLETKNSLLQRATEIHNQLTRMVLEGRGVEAITATLARLLNLPVQVEDQGLRLLAYGQPPGGGNAAGPETIGEEAVNQPGIQEFLSSLQKQQRPLPLPGWESCGLSAPRVMAPIVAGGETLGYVSVLDSGGGFEDLDFVAVEHAATVYALQFMQNRVACQVEEKIRGQFVEDLVYGRLDEGEILQRALYLGYDPRSFYQVMIVQVYAGPAGEDSGLDPVVNRDFSGLPANALRVIRECTRDQGFRFIAARSNPMLVLVETGAGPRKQGVLDLAEAVHRRVKAELGATSVIVGIGGPARGVRDLQMSYRQAEKAFRIARRLKWDDAVVPFDSIGAYQVFLHVDRQEVLRDYVAQTLGPLLAYDREKNGSLVATLKAFAGCNFNLQKTAQHLFIHINTLKYRMQRIREIGGLNLDNPEQRFNVQFAMKILDTVENWQV